MVIIIIFSKKELLAHAGFLFLFLFLVEVLDSFMYSVMGQQFTSVLLLF